jgi:peptidoglycan/xylan/chitin deacetylase (PgdA/CDA1 family)
MFVRVRSFCLLTALVAAAASGLTGANPLESGADRKVAGRAVARTKFGSVPYGASITKCTVPGKIALTFDDGPCEFTGQVLDTLEANGAKGTFFVVGASGDAGIASGKYTSVLKRMVANGHQIGSHSYSHADFETLSNEGKIAELTKLEDAFVATLGYIPTYFRPPYTSCGSQCYAALGEMGYHVVCYCSPLVSLGVVSRTDEIFSTRPTTTLTPRTSRTVALPLRAFSRLPSREPAPLASLSSSSPTTSSRSPSVVSFSG